jgi:nucleotidyltransferase/DNA polymerase involved in DNA repair
MDVCLHVSLDGFYAAQVKEERPTVVFEDDRVVDATERARELGVRPGQSLADARSLARDRAEFVAYQADQYTEVQREWLDACLPYSGRIEPESPSSAWIDLAGHPDPAYVAGLLLHDLAVRFSYRISAGLAPAKWIAEIAARPCDPVSIRLGLISIEPVTDVATFLYPLPIGLLAPVATEHRARLAFLGYRRIGDVREAPLGVLIEQFGKDAMLIQEAAAGRYRDAVVPTYPPDSLERSRRFLGAVDDRLTIEEAVREIASDLAEVLQARDRLADETHLYIEQEGGRVVGTGRKLPRPTSSEASLSISLLYMLAQTKLTEPIAAVRVSVPRPRLVGRVQRALDASLSVQDRQYSVELATEKVRSVFGQRAVQRADQIEVPRRLKVLHAWKETTDWH